MPVPDAFDVVIIGMQPLTNGRFITRHRSLISNGGTYDQRGNQFE